MFVTFVLGASKEAGTVSFQQFKRASERLGMRVAEKQLKAVFAPFEAQLRQRGEGTLGESGLSRQRSLRLRALPNVCVWICFFVQAGLLCQQGGVHGLCVRGKGTSGRAWARVFISSCAMY